MKKKQFLFLLLVPFLMGTTPTIIGLDRVHVGNKSPQKIGTWKYTPSVIICEGAPTNKKDIDKAIAWWKNRGYRFYETIGEEDPLGKCQSEFPEGFIVVKIGTQKMFTNNEDLAQTHFNVDDSTKQISWAKIYLRSSPMERVLEHEIGHALGFLHSDNPGHLMYRQWIRGGWGDKGLRQM
jgi:predicted Zn-dependent protease